MDFDLTGKAALVTGSSAGIGAGIARALAREGATVIVHGRSAQRSAAVAGAIRASGGVAHVALGDLETDDGARAVADQAFVAVPRVDILVNNVGGPESERNGFFDTTIEEWASLFNGNAIAAVRMIHLLVPAMRERGWGRVIQISSRNGISPHKTMPAYGAAKSAMNNFTLALSKEPAFSGVTCNAIMPGLIETQQFEAFRSHIARERFAGDHEAAEHFILRDICRQTVGRLSCVDDVADYVCFLASSRADFITGTALRIDGGSTPTT